MLPLAILVIFGPFWTELYVINENSIYSWVFLHLKIAKLSNPKRLVVLGNVLWLIENWDVSQDPQFKKHRSTEKSCWTPGLLYINYNRVPIWRLLFRWLDTSRSPRLMCHSSPIPTIFSTGGFHPWGDTHSLQVQCLLLQMPPWGRKTQYATLFIALIRVSRTLDESTPWNQCWKGWRTCNYIAYFTSLKLDNTKSKVNEASKKQIMH